MENRTDSENEQLISICSSTMMEEAEETIQSQDYPRITNLVETKALYPTFLISIWTSFTLTLAAILLSLLMTAALYFDMSTTNICFEVKQRGNILKRSVMKWVLAGHLVEVVALHFWFQLALILILTWHEFKTRHRNTLLIALLQGCFVCMYKVILFAENIDFTLHRYRYTGNAVFLCGLIYTGYVVSKKICAIRPANDLKKLKVFKIITAQYVLGGIIVMTYRYLTIPWFISVKNENIKAIIAITVLSPVMVLNIINERVALSSSQFVEPGRNFLFVSFEIGASILVFSIMQADVKRMDVFTALSAYRGFVHILLAATEKLRNKILGIVCKYFRRYFSICRRLSQNNQQGDGERLKADVYIQLMLYQTSALIMGQAYQALYVLNNFYTQPWDVLSRTLTKVAIGSGIHFFSNSVSIFVYVYWHDSKLPALWCEAWRLHSTAVLLGSVMIMVYFNTVLLTVFEGPQQGLVAKNCTVPF